MSAGITTEEYRALAELRYRIRLFLREGDAKARAVGLEPQQYVLLLALRGLPGDVEATIVKLAERMMLKHHSVVELVDRLAAHGYVRRMRSREDRRKVLVSLLPRGVKLVEEVARQRISELRASGAQLVAAIAALLKAKRKIKVAAPVRRGREGKSRLTRGARRGRPRSPKPGGFPRA
jgi:DNA-binding MarR family transcriptional regulator